MSIKESGIGLNGPEQIIEMASGYQKSRIILTAFELDIFTAIGDGSLTSEAIAERINAKAGSTERLLNALCALGFLDKKEGCYSNTEASSLYLVKGSEKYLSRIGHMINLYRTWGTLTMAVQAGTSVTEREYDPVSLVRFIDAMHHRAKKSAGELVSHIDLTGVNTVLDMGGGSGVYSMAFVNAKPGLRAVVFDLPEVTALARNYIAENGLTDRITTLDGDYNRDDFGGGYDLVFMSAIVHINSFDDNVALVKKARRSLKGGGRIVIQDHIMAEDRTSPARGAIFALNMLVNTKGGDTYTEKEMREWLSRAGCAPIERIYTGMENDLMVGTVPA
jgi:predicted O-methyltransferase YrrM